MLRVNAGWGLRDEGEGKEGGRIFRVRRCRLEEVRVVKFSRKWPSRLLCLDGFLRGLALNRFALFLGNGSYCRCDFSN